MESTICLLRLPSDCVPAEYLTHGAILAAPDGATPPYEPFALVPAHAFEIITQQPLSRASAIALERSRPMVALVSLEHAVAPVIGRGHDAHDNGSPADAIATFPLDAVVDAVKAALRGTFTWSPSRFSMIGLAESAPGSLTTTINRANGHRLGLHFDSWDHLPIAERGASRTRISVNVGACDRYLLFVAMTAIEVVAIIQETGIPPGNLTTIFRQAWRMQPAIRAFRLRVPPGWAYVAPTDNLPHDGSTIGATAHDISVHMLGDFRPLKSFFDTSTFLNLDPQAGALLSAAPSD